jgi:hypothetical protein
MPRFDHDLLDKLSERDGATITKEYEFVCKCGNPETKRFGSFIYPSKYNLKV